MCCSAGQGTFLGNQFGPGTGPVLLDNVVCSGSEYVLDDCAHSAIGATNCTNSQDVSVSCAGTGQLHVYNSNLLSFYSTFTQFSLSFYSIFTQFFYLVVTEFLLNFYSAFTQFCSVLIQFFLLSCY